MDFPQGGMKMNGRPQTSDLRRLKSLSLKRASPHIYLRRFHMMMCRTSPVLPIGPAEPLSRGIGGRIDPSTQSSLVLAEVVADTSFLPAQDDDTRVPLFADFRASRHIYLRRSRHHDPEPRTPNPEPRTPNPEPRCTCQQKLDTKLKKLGIKIEYLYKIQ